MHVLTPLRTCLLGILVGLCWSGTAWGLQIASPVLVSPHGRPRGTVVLIHGGGWTAHGRDATRSMLSIAGDVSGWGYRAISIDYAPGRAGLADVLSQLDRIHATHRHEPVCVLGVSSGGHWALMAGAYRSWISCVIALIAPTDLVAPVVFAPQSTLAQLASAAFGGALAAYSPLRVADRIRGRVLLVNGVDDPVVPLAQGIVMHLALGWRSQLVVLPHGDVAWGHSATTAQALTRLSATERAWLAATMTPG